MKKALTLSLTLLCLIAATALTADSAAKKYELTKTDMFAIAGDFNSDNITVLGIAHNTPLSEVFAKFNLSKKDITKNSAASFLEIKPGFKLRLTSKNEIETLIITKEFKGSLIGKTAKLFDSGTSAKNFVAYVTKAFPGTKEANPIDDGPFFNQSITYYAGFGFQLIGMKNEPDVIMEITFNIPGNTMKN